MEDLGKLVKELLNLAVTARTYLNLRAVKEGLVAPQLDAAGKDVPADKPAPRKKEKVAEKEAPAPEKKTVAAALGGPALPAMSEKESLDAAFKLGTAFVQKDGAEKVEQNKAVLRDFLAKYNSKNLSGLSHPNRLEVIPWLKAQLEPKTEDALS